MTRGEQDSRLAILEFERVRQRALTEPDLGVLEGLLADDLVHIHSTGMVHDKPAFLNHIRRMGGFVSIEREVPEIRVEGHLAVVTGVTINTVRSLETGERMVRHGFSTLILRQVEQRWEVVLSQLTPVRDRS
ncbi:MULTISPECIES: nuclear transport factor 2 family protein [Marinobacter]|uniref:nuclear transport factor 2 family protein n=1 Tax=Marinobacter TaxID=2742 RepID=UPI000DADF825|nr:MULTISPECIES: nuclear transport factor 2 family protein [Marinobacter]